ncbi:unknown [Bacteroides sp. CAG:633]|nr:unknown [Bacteroides sp. CAG:633]
MEAEGLASLHRHGEYLLYQPAEALQLLLADAQVAFALAGVVGLVEVEQGIGGGIGHGNGGFQFVGDVVGKVAFHFLQRLLPQDGVDEVPEGEAEDEEDDRRSYQYACHLPQHEASQRFGGKTIDIVFRRGEGVLVADGIGTGHIAGCAACGQGIGIEPAVLGVVARVQVLQAVAYGDVHFPEAGVEQAVVYTEIGTSQYVEPRVQSALQVNGHAGHGALVAQQHVEPLLCMKHGVGAHGICLYPL